MVATLLNSEIAIRRSVEIIRAFTALENNTLSSHSDDIFQMISSQSKMISVLADEMYRNRRSIKNHDNQITSVESRLTNLEKHLWSVNFGQKEEKSIPSISISLNQAQALRDIVKEKGKTKKGMMKIWFEFKQKFDLTRYVHLPQHKFEEALQWLKQLER